MVAAAPPSGSGPAREPARFSGLPRLSEVGRRGRVDVLLAAARVRLERGDAGIRARVLIEEDPRVATSSEERRVMENRSEYGIEEEVEVRRFLRGEADSCEAWFRFSAGGSIVVLELEGGEQYVFLVVKGLGELHELHLSVTSGVSKDTEMWVDPRLLTVTEPCEELAVLSRRLDAYYKVRVAQNEFLGSEFATKANAWAEAEARESLELLRRWGVLSGDVEVVEAEAQLLPLGFDTMEVVWEGRARRAYEGLLVVDPQYGALDMIAAMVVKVGASSLSCLLYTSPSPRDRG